MYRELTISGDVPHTKLNKAFKTGKLSLSAAELKGSGSIIHLHPESYAKALKSRKAGRGVRLDITRHEIKKGYKRAQGGSIWSKIWSGIKKGFKFAKDSGLLSKAADVVIPAAATALGSPELALPARAAIRSMTGVGVDNGGRITMSDVKAKTKQALRYAKNKGIITDVVDAGERYLVSKSNNPDHHTMIHSLRKELKNRYGVGIPKQYKHFVKGSAEAKAHMAQLRAKRKTKASGGSFRLS